jgi:hypothetical protein
MKKLLSIILSISLIAASAPDIGVALAPPGVATITPGANRNTEYISNSQDIFVARCAQMLKQSRALTVEMKFLELLSNDNLIPAKVAEKIKRLILAIIYFDQSGEYITGDNDNIPLEEDEIQDFLSIPKHEWQSRVEQLLDNTAGNTSVTFRRARINLTVMYNLIMTKDIKNAAEKAFIASVLTGDNQSAPNTNDRRTEAVSARKRELGINSSKIFIAYIYQSSKRNYIIKLIKAVIAQSNGIPRIDNNDTTETITQEEVREFMHGDMRIKMQSLKQYIAAYTGVLKNEYIAAFQRLKVYTEDYIGNLAKRKHAADQQAARTVGASYLAPPGASSLDLTIKNISSEVLAAEKVIQLTKIIGDICAKRGYVHLAQQPHAVMIVAGDRLGLTSAVSNIIDNAYVSAVKDHAGEMHVNVEISPEIIDGKEFVRIDIEDNGQGIPARLLTIDPATNRPHIFNLNVSEREGGTGLGTTEAWYAITGAGGSIEVDSLDQDGFETMRMGDFGYGYELAALLGKNEKSRLQTKIAFERIEEANRQLDRVFSKIMAGNITRDTCNELVNKYMSEVIPVRNEMLETLRDDTDAGALRSALNDHFNKAFVSVGIMLFRKNMFNNRKNYREAVVAIKHVMNEYKKLMINFQRLAEGRRITPGTTFTIRLPITTTPELVERSVRLPDGSL